MSNVVPVVPASSDGEEEVILNTSSPRVRWCFTSFSVNSENKKWLNFELVPKVKFLIFGLETCPTTKKEHYQGYVEFKTKIRFKQVKKVLEKINPSIRSSRGSKEDNIKYCSKEGDYWINGARERKPKVLTTEEFYDWQKSIIQICDNEPDERSIHWIWDENGGIGKTAIAKYIFSNYRAITANGKADNIKFAVANYRKINGYYPDVIIFTIPRTTSEYVSYSALEEVKDGLIFSGKFESCGFIMPNPHIFVFCNFPPDIDALSLDRWMLLDRTDCLQTDEAIWKRAI